MTNRYLPNIYAVGLNVPLAAVYGWSASPGQEFPTTLGVAIWLGLVGLLIFEVYRRLRMKSEKSPVIFVLTGTLMMWSSLFFGYPNLGDPENRHILHASRIGLFGGVGLVVVGMFAAFRSQRRAIMEPFKQPGAG